MMQPYKGYFIEGSALMVHPFSQVGVTRLGSSLELNRYSFVIIISSCHDPCESSSPEPYTT